MSADLGELLRRVELVDVAHTHVEVALDASGIGIWWFDGTLHVSNRFQALLGYEPGDEPPAHGWRDLGPLVHPDDRALLDDAIRNHLEALWPCDVELRFATAHRDHRWYRLSARAAMTDDGVVVLAGTLADISARKQAEDRNAELQEELRVAQKLEAVGQLAAGIAHEINTPIQYIGDNTRFLGKAAEKLAGAGEIATRILDLAAEGALDAKAIDACRAELARLRLDFIVSRVPRATDAVIDGVERVAEIVSAMKRFAHTDTEVTSCDLRELVETTLTIAKNEYKYVADVTTEIDEALPLVRCRRNEINQVILNLVVNAAHAIGARETETRGALRVAAARDGDYAVLSVTDDGVGIPEDIRERIFEPFFTTKEVGKGSGQGLALVYNVVRAHEGTITVDSIPGETTFRVRLPLEGPATSARVSGGAASARARPAPCTPRCSGSKGAARGA